MLLILASCSSDLSRKSKCERGLHVRFLNQQLLAGLPRCLLKLYIFGRRCALEPQHISTLHWSYGCDLWHDWDMPIQTLVIFDRPIPPFCIWFCDSWWNKYLKEEQRTALEAPTHIMLQPPNLSAAIKRFFQPLLFSQEPRGKVTAFCVQELPLISNFLPPWLYPLHFLPYCIVQ